MKESLTSWGPTEGRGKRERREKWEGGPLSFSGGRVENKVKGGCVLRDWGKRTEEKKR